MYELFGARGAGSTVVEAALELTGAPYRVTVATPWEPDANVDRLRSLNPLVQVPTLVLPDGTVMTESAAMVLHLADRDPDAGLAPAPDDPLRVHFLRWLVYVVANVYATFTLTDDPTRFVTEPAAQDELRRNADERRRMLWRVVEGHAAATPWFLGDRFSAVDLYVATMVHWRPGRAWFADACPKLDSIARTVAADPRFAPVMARNFDAP